MLRCFYRLSIKVRITGLKIRVFQLYEQGQSQQAIAIATRACNLARQCWGKNNLNYANTLKNLALVYQEIGDYQKALEFYSQTLSIQRQLLGEQHLDFATTLHNLAVLYYKIGEYSQAEVSIEQVLAITRQNKGEDCPDFAASLNTQAMLCEIMGKYRKAELIYRQVIEIQRKTLGEEHPNLATSLQNLGQLLYATLNQYSDAESLLQQAFQIRLKVLGKNHPDFAISLGCLAELYEAKGNYKKAQSFLQQALDINCNVLGKNHPDCAMSMSSLGQLYEIIGNYRQAESLYKQAFDIFSNTLGENHPDFAIILQDLAALYAKMGDRDRAKPLLERAVEIERLNKGEEHPDFALLVSNLASLYTELGNYAAAKPLYQQAINIQRNILGDRHPDLSVSLHSLAILYYDIGDYQKVESVLQEALDIVDSIQDEQHSDIALILNSLAMLYEKLEKYTDAELLHQRAIETTRQILGEQHSAFAMSLNNLAEMYRWLGRYSEAEPLYIKGMKIIRTVLGEKHPHFAIALHNLAGLYKEMGNYIKAEEFYQQDREITVRSLGENHPSFAISLRNSATLYAAIDRQKEALGLLMQTAAIDNQIVGQVFSMSSEHQRIAYLKTIDSNFYIFLSLVWQFFQNSTQAKQESLNLILRRKGIIAETLAIQRDAVLGGRYPMLQSQLKKLSTLRMQIARLTLTGVNNLEELEEHTDRLTEWNTQKEELEGELARQIPEMNLGQKLQQINWQDIAELIPDRAVFIEFVYFDEYNFKAIPAHQQKQWQLPRYLAFILLAEKPEQIQMKDLGEAEPIDLAIAKFRASITGNTQEREFETVSRERITGKPDAGVELRQKIFDPLLEFIGNRDRLFLAPDGDLNKLPFEVLPTDNGDRLIDRYRISYLGTGRDLLRFGVKTRGEPTAPLVLADPDFNLSLGDAIDREPDRNPNSRISRDFSRSSPHFKPLPSTRKEGEEIAKMLGVKPWVQEEVLESKLKACRSPRILHIATHGFFLKDQKQDLNREKFTSYDRLSGSNLENPLLRSGLALAGANTWLKKEALPPDAEDGILTAEDVSGLDLLDTELVVLSACETGLGEVQTGEGVFGLRRAFILAGAKTLVMSLWKVPDQQTEELMTDYYRRILTGDPRGEALRSAQLEMKKKYPNPRYWGAFICQGEIAPLL